LYPSAPHRAGGWRPIAGYGAGGWTYHLRDGEGSLRQTADENGTITLARTYQPLGGILEEEGRYETAFGFLGAQLDRVSGLLYAGGRYYDPATGRYLTPANSLDLYNPRTLNPYAPWYDPTLWLLAPLAVFVALKGGKKRQKNGYWLLLLLMVGTGVSLVACKPTPEPPPTEPPPMSPPAETPTPPPPLTWTPPPTSIPTVTPLPPTATFTCMPIPPTPTPTPWETRYGIAIAQAAHDLLNNATNYYIWGAHDEEYYIDAPPRRPPQPGDTWWNYGVEIDLYQRVGDRTPIVCADVIALSYENAGLDLAQTYPHWFAGGEYDATRDATMLGTLLRDFNQEHLWGDGTLPELGDMILRAGYTHSAVVAEIAGDDASQIFVIEASYPNDTIRKVSLATWGAGGTHFGHPKVPGS